MANTNDASWFDKGAATGQDGASEEQGEELPVEDDEQGEVMQEVSPKEIDEANAELKTEKEEPKKQGFKIPAAQGRRAPPWAKIPKDMKFPRGIQVLFIRIRAELTMYPSKGDRQVILWALTDADEKLAIGRSMANAARAGVEMAKQMIRAIDGERINWTGNPNEPGADIDTFWHQIGPKGRNLLQRLFNQLHAMNEDELVDFFENCIGVVSTG